jgi:predicted nucleic acid-binding protein
VIVVDTNILVRFLVDDDEAGQHARAVRILAGGDILLLDGVLLETEWVLRSRYRFARKEIAQAFRGLIALPGVRLADDQRVQRALDWHEAGLDFADALHLATLRADDRFVTFDRDLVRRASRLQAAPVVQAP